MNEEISSFLLGYFLGLCKKEGIVIDDFVKEIANKEISKILGLSDKR